MVSLAAFDLRLASLSALMASRTATLVIATASAPRLSIDGFPIWEIYEIHTGEVVDERDHEGLARAHADDLTDEFSESHGYEYAARLAV